MESEKERSFIVLQEYSYKMIKVCTNNSKYYFLKRSQNIVDNAYKER